MNNHERVFLLPGFGGSSRGYENYSLKFKNFQVIDFSNAISLKDHLSIVQSKIDQDDSKVILIGVSWGSILAFHIAELNSEKVVAVITGGAGRSINLPISLTWIMKFPFYVFTLMVIMFIMAFPAFFLLDRRGYRQKYGGIGVLQRLGWRRSHEVYNNTLLRTYYAGDIRTDTLFLNLSSDFLVNLKEVENLIESNKGQNHIEAKLLDLTHQHHIHFTHELDDLIIAETDAFLTNLTILKKRSLN